MPEGEPHTASAHKIEHHTAILADLRDACEWLGVKHGRAKLYQRLIQEFWEGPPHHENHIFVHNEAYEIVDIFRLWRQRTDEFPGLKAKFSKSLGSGPVLREGEVVSTSGNRARNDAFVYYLAGEFIKAGIDVIAVDGCIKDGQHCHYTGDITIRYESLLLDVQCKRPQTSASVAKRLKEARHQIEKAPIKAGIIGLDCSAFVRPPRVLLDSTSSSVAANRYQTLMLSQVVHDLSAEFRPSILCAYLFTRGPAMITTHEYRLLTYRGKPFREVRPESISVGAVVRNPSSTDSQVAVELFNRMRRTLH